MSVKRQATTELNHDNWDQEDPSEHEEMGSFKSATKDILEKRVIRTAKRRTQVSGEAKKGVFSGFGGFNKTQPSSFDFLAKLTNGSTNANETPNKNETSVTSSLFLKKSPIGSTPITSQGNGVFDPQGTTPTKPNFGIPMSQTSSLFGGSLATSTVLSGFTASKADSTVGDSPLKIQPVSSSADTKTTNANSNTSQVTSTIFGIPSTSANTNKSLFSTNTNSTPFKIQPVSSTSTTVATGFGIMTKAASNTTSSENNVEEKSNAKKIKYYTKLKGLNGSVSDWIKKHVEQTPLCILSPIFKDYEKYLKEIQDEYHSPEEGEPIKVSDTKTTPTESMSLGNVTSSKSISVFSNNNAKNSSNAESPTPKPSFLGTQNNADKPSFSFGINNSTSPSTNTATTTAGFSFGINTAQPTTATTSTSFSFGTNTSTTTSNVTAPFSFGIGKPFAFNSNVQSNTEKVSNENEEDEEPPKTEFTPVVEENTVFEKRCKIYVKKDGNFVDKGVGTLYIKNIVESGKHQLLVRANTSLGNILLNLILATAIPTQRMGKNNVMMVCIPTPDSKPPPTPVLIRVKTSEEADELLSTLNKYKM